MRLIDADALKHELFIRQHLLNADSLWKTLEIMDAQPTADVVERKKGKWYVRDITRYGGKPYVCTVCGRGANDVYHFCPSCGAAMREEKTDETN